MRTLKVKKNRGREDKYTKMVRQNRIKSFLCAQVLFYMQSSLSQTKESKLYLIKTRNCIYETLCPSH